MRLPWTAFLAPSSAALQFACKTLFAAGLALWLAYRFDLEQPSWACMTVIVVSQPLSGMVVAKGLFRLLGTLVGTSMAVVIMALFAQTPWLFLLALSLWLALCTAASTLLRNHVAYGFVLAGYTAAIICLPSIAQPLEVFDHAIARCTEICLGLLVGSAVHALFWPQRVEANLFAEATRTWRQAVTAARAELAGTENAVQGLLALLGQMVAIDSQRDHAWFEGYRGRQRARALRLLSRDLLGVLRTARGAARQVRNLDESQRPLVQPWLEAVLTALDEPHAEPLAALTQKLREAVAEAPLDSDQRYLLARLAILLDKIAIARQSLESVDTTRLEAAAPSALAHHRDVQTALLYGLRSAGSLLGLGLFWLGSAWSAGPGAMLIAGVVCSLFANRDNAFAVGLGFMRGIFYACLLAILLSQLLVPQANSFPLLCLVLGGPLFFATLGMAGPLAGRGTATAFALFLLSLTVPRNESVTELDALLNTELGLLIGVGWAVLMFRLFTLSAPRRTTKRILEATLYDLQRLTSLPLRTAEPWFGGRMADRLLLLARHIDLLPSHERHRWALGLLALDLGNELLHLRACLAQTKGELRSAQEAFLGRFAESLAEGADGLQPNRLDDVGERLRHALIEAADGESNRLAWSAVGQLQQTWRSFCLEREASSVSA
ncbi:fusaric acid resistance protein [Pseudomonas oryzihabitans]|nr:fusaric acid resistance protein [Pseudomonas psychrotolerans]KTT40963.1 fusaric acid resistance protein [Pseudomonas psychrotolerans]KTT45034.1 fusaric acid resistance protein [Pseudomonas psychrotolerans]